VHLDNDVLPPKGFITSAIQALEDERNNLGLIGVNYEETQYLVHNNIQLKSLGNLNGGTLVIPKATLDTVGYLYPDVSGRYHGDFLYSMRVRATGRALAYIRKPGKHLEETNHLLAAAARQRFDQGLHEAFKLVDQLHKGEMPVQVLDFQPEE
jgi:hypothetical protein